MGKKPLIVLAGLCLAGVALCGCQDKQNNGGWRKSSPGGMQVPPSGNGGIGASGWDNGPAKNMASRPGSSDLMGGSGYGLASGAGAGSNLGSSGLGNGMRQPTGGLAAGSGMGMGGSTGMGGGSAWGGSSTPMAGSGGLSHTGGLGMGAGDSRLADPPPSSGSLPGNSSAPGLGGMGSGLSGSSLTPPPGPAVPRPGPTSNLNLGGDSPPGAPPAVNQSNVTNNYRTVPPALDSGVPPLPQAVPTMRSNSLDQ